MANFPASEEKILTLGQRMSSGFKANTGLYPSPPADATVLDAGIAAFVAAQDAVAAARAAAAQATLEKKAVLKTFVEHLKANLRYAELVTSYNDANLKTIGWGGRREPTPLAAPGRTLDLVSVEQGDDWIALAWEQPTEGGKATRYEVQCRERTGEDADYRTVATTADREVTLTDQERGKEMEYVVVAVNRAGRGPISNAVMAVL
uniref:Fibronectin type III domain-containing protein n=1 Tax=Candidatus Kentrum eta TaxID=2126337 RepID=A0A450UNN7_9GAMM|nr:MAG: Fibronectin type III domain-containing protein [Candidatus Kentron sp. H]VFJ94164.1 MAG: Fibronectin type III domain-containing protein [Candidatus Kentron sp. H]VFK00765.1 MAG: Fibronectin type III domain-containing protein [Candidatus Kentron sp. H]